MEQTQKKQTLAILEVLLKGYQTGNFAPVYPLLAEDCTWQSEWVDEPVEGKEAVMAYYEKKGSITRNSKTSSLHYFLVELTELATLGLLMASSYADRENGALLTLDLNEEGLVTGLEVGRPELYDLQRYAG